MKKKASSCRPAGPRAYQTSEAYRNGRFHFAREGLGRASKAATLCRLIRYIGLYLHNGR